MKYCPLCAAEYLESRDRCASCGAGLVASLDAEEVRKNPPRLLWIGGPAAEFDAVASALREADIPALVEEGPTRILQRFLKSESQICVLQKDFQRALETAVKAIAERPRGHGSTQKCHQCEEECSAALTVCPKCAATLILEREPKQQPSAMEEPRVLTASKYCPLCDTEYPANYQHCTVCGVELMAEEMRGKPLSKDDLRQKIVIIWRGGDPVAVSNVVGLLRGAGIRHHVESTHDYLVFGLAMPRPNYTLRVLQGDAERAKELLVGITDSPLFVANISPDFPEEAASRVHPDEIHWNAAAATAEIWTGDDAAMAKLLEDCLRENKIGFRREGRGPQQLRLFVTKKDEARAREILREVREGTPPA